MTAAELRVAYDGRVAHRNTLRNQLANETLTQKQRSRIERDEIEAHQSARVLWDCLCGITVAEKRMAGFDPEPLARVEAEIAATLEKAHEPAEVAEWSEHLRLVQEGFVGLHVQTSRVSDEMARLLARQGLIPSDLECALNHRRRLVAELQERIAELTAQAEAEIAAVAA